MIDTDKYEGHEFLNDNNIEHYELTDVDYQMLRDAPLLLAEVKRWRKVYQYIHHLYSSNQKTVPLYELMELIEEEVIE
tara:strand:+ start:51 stop:284 length:234 start_codon:yes stop_codon:yes gene_type:complete